MPLALCTLCGKPFDPRTLSDNKGLCRECLHNLDEIYSHIHKYIAGMGEVSDITPQKVADETDTNLEDVKLLFDLGFFERDIQTYSHTLSERQMLAEEFEHELNNMAERRKLNTYGGIIYRRKK